MLKIACKNFLEVVIELTKTSLKISYLRKNQNSKENKCTEI